MSRPAETQPPICPVNDLDRYHRLKSIEFVGGFLDGMKFNLAEGLSCLIGHRGTGKTTALEFVRYALDEFRDNGDAGQARKRVESLVQANLSGSHSYPRRLAGIHGVQASRPAFFTERPTFSVAGHPSPSAAILSVAALSARSARDIFCEEPSMSRAERQRAWACRRARPGPQRAATATSIRGGEWLLATPRARFDVKKQL